MLDIILQYAIPKEDDGFDWGGLLFFTSFLIGIPYYIYKKYQANLRDPFSFNLKKQLSEDSLLNVYICLSSQMIKNDLRDVREKIDYMNKYFRSHFPNEHKGFTEILNAAYHEELDYYSLIIWLKVKLPAHKDRVQIIYFLVGMAFIDGAVNRKELNFTNNLAMRLGLTPKEFESIIGMHQSYEEKSQKAKQVTAPKVSKLELCSQILGVSQQASMDEIKKAYRKLVKLHHPDRFYNSSPEQQKIAEERFLSIQKAYEIMEILKKTG